WLCSRWLSSPSSASTSSSSLPSSWATASPGLVTSSLRRTSPPLSSTLSTRSWATSRCGTTSSPASRSFEDASRQQELMQPFLLYLFCIKQINYTCF
ncbi:uncharacterized protein ACA1_281350, partial [Acanthamoeba castellanii str. Neff]